MTSKMTPILNKQIANQKQTQTLETLRDNLLPKLMSGEVRVKITPEESAKRLASLGGIAPDLQAIPRRQTEA